MFIPQSVYTTWSFANTTLSLHALCWTPPAQAGDLTAVCVHGLTRNAWDFQDVAEALVAKGYTVWSLDIVGRGNSDALPDPLGYSTPTYVAQVQWQLAQLGIIQVDLWVGTSMGGIIGMLLAASGYPIERLFLNDVGALLPVASLGRIAQGLRSNEFKTREAAQASFKVRYAAFDIPEHRWSFLFDHGIIANGNGGFRFAYDARIADNVELTSGQDIPLWPVWMMIVCPVLLFRAEHSDLLTADIAEGMTVGHPQLTVVEIWGCGHAPSLMQPHHLKPISDWL